jgi:hypothetical protein
MNIIPYPTFCHLSISSPPFPTSSPHSFPSSHLLHLLLNLSSSSCSSSNTPFLNLHPLPSSSLIPSNPLSPGLLFTSPSISLIPSNPSRPTSLHPSPSISLIPSNPLAFTLLPAFSLIGGTKSSYMVSSGSHVESRNHGKQKVVYQ